MESLVDIAYRVISLAGWGIGPTMLVAAAVKFAGFLLCLFLAEETRGMTLAQAGGEAAHDGEAAPSSVGSPEPAAATSDATAVHAGPAPRKVRARRSGLQPPQVRAGPPCCPAKIHKIHKVHRLTQAYTG
ncbi:hypothetical protein [Sinomonas mesophila]|uniref:hypothetical protein n=1 Tax=Sinomonas mesophila TaxID=1531955 RepID=UPI0009869A2A|nr:hypothetical protein [Sinomonas mesophila]